MLFTKFARNQKPLVVEVGDGQWNAYAQNVPPTPQDEALFAILTAIGGINESVTPGRYHFNAQTSGLGKLELSLEPIQE